MARMTAHAKDGKNSNATHAESRTSRTANTVRATVRACAWIGNGCLEGGSASLGAPCLLLGRDVMHPLHGSDLGGHFTHANRRDAAIDSWGLDQRVRRPSNSQAQ